MAEMRIRNIAFIMTLQGLRRKEIFGETYEIIYPIYYPRELTTIANRKKQKIESERHKQ